MHLRDIVTLLTTFKPFKGENFLLQNTAIDTWRFHELPVIVFGDEYGSLEAVEILEAEHVPNVPSSSGGVPYVSAMIQQGCAIAKTEYIALINGDICLDAEFARALEHAILCDGERFGNFRFFSGRRRNIPIWRRGADPSATMDIVTEVDASYGCWDRDDAIDIFVFSKRLFGDIPNLAIGRSGWDNWLVAEAKRLNAVMVDLTLSASLKHPIHGYLGPMGGWEKLLINSETRENQRLVAGHTSSFKDMNYVFKNNKIEPKSQNEEEEIKRYTVTTFNRELNGMLKYLSEANLSDAEKTDIVKTVFWRNEVYFPILRSNQLRSCDIEVAWAALTNDGSGSAISIIQDLLAANLLGQIKELAAQNRYLVVWGAGGLAKRFLRWLDRHDTGVMSMVVQTNPTCSMVEGHMVSSPVFCEKLESPMVVIASMYFYEIRKENRALFKRIKAELIF